MAEDYAPGKGIACIHFLYADENGKVKSAGVAGGILDTPAPGGQFAVACNPQSKLPTHATGLHSAVTCPACKKSDAFKKAVVDSQVVKLGDSEADKAIAESFL